MAHVPSLEGSTYITDPQSIIAFTWRKFGRNLKDILPIIDDEIISLRWLVAKYGNDITLLTENIRTDLQRCLDRIFNGERDIQVSTSYEKSENGTTSITVSITYTTNSGDIEQLGTSISLNERNELEIPEDSVIGLNLSV